MPTDVSPPPSLPCQEIRVLSRTLTGRSRTLAGVGENEVPGEESRF